jgi:transcriptional regulator with XRE-family HTH domain
MGRPSSANHKKLAARIGKNILAMRTRMSVNQKELSAIMKVHPASLFLWEQGKTIPTLDKIVELCFLFGISTDQFINEDIKP